jgi:hypothetical protein
MEESISRRVSVYGEVKEVKAAEAFGRGRKRAEREGKWKAFKAVMENDLGCIAVYRRNGRPG